MKGRGEGRVREGKEEKGEEGREVEGRKGQGRGRIASWLLGDGRPCSSVFYLAFNSYRAPGLRLVIMIRLS